MGDALFQGRTRYGGPDARQKYLTRLKKELKAYERTGNAVHLRNIANYAHLEDCAPEHPKYHIDEYIASVTRDEIMSHQRVIQWYRGEE